MVLQGDAGLWTARLPLLCASSRGECCKGWGAQLWVFSIFPRGGRCEKHVSSLPVTGRRPRSPVGSGLLWVQLRVQIQECQEAAQTHLSQIPIFP